MVAWPLKDGEDMMVSISVTEAMALSAALRTSCEHPGFTMLFTFIAANTGRSKERNCQPTHCIGSRGAEINKIREVPSLSTPAAV